MRSIAYVSSFFVAATTLGFCDTPEERAVQFLTREVPRWSAENKCFSCHNNGDGARALYTAARLGYAIPDSALADTTRWLMEPAGWDKTRANAAISDKKLARIQFAAALSEVTSGGKKPLTEAAQSLINEQSADGSWQIDDGGNIGSPVTYGVTLATVLSRRTLERAGRDSFSSAIDKATEWLQRNEPRSILDAAATLLALPKRTALLDTIARAQTPGGGWGPQLHAPAEPFDTAVVLLALRGLNDVRAAEMIRRGRAFLVAAQQPSGGWPETTRPAGSQSYAQHISTSAWAALALLETDPKRQ